MDGARSLCDDGLARHGRLDPRPVVMRVLVTGATGFVASHLVPALAADGHEVIAARPRRRSYLHGAGCEPARLVGPALPPTDFRTWTRSSISLRRTSPSPTGPARSSRSTPPHRRACSTMPVARGATPFRLRVVGLGLRLRRPAAGPRTTFPAATDFYSATKLASERFARCVRRRSSPPRSLRLVAPYGPGQRNRLIPRLVESVRAGRPVTLNDGGRPRMNPIEVGDVVEVVRAILASELRGNHVLNVAGPDAVSIEELAEAIGTSDRLLADVRARRGRLG